jgi:hypothetical protein
LQELVKISKMNFGENTHCHLDFCEEIYLSKDALMFASSVLSNLCSNYQAHTKTKEKPFA